jgi:putative SOS response-associated peptidase YedK
MCYSAQVEQKFAQYVRLTGAQIDVEQFAELYGPRWVPENIRIPRVVDRWFDHPATDGEKKIHALILANDSATIATLEQELFAQKKRLADAERKLAEKPTKAASESRRIATDKADKIVKKLAAIKDTRVRLSDSRIFPMQYAPIVINDHGRKVIRLARYHCRLPGKPASVDRQFPGLYNARRDNIEKYWGNAFGSTHALMLAESFFENVDRDGRNAVLHFVPRPAETMLIACVYSTWKDPQGEPDLLSFAAITDEPPPEVAAAGHDRMIINIKPENVNAWLSPEGLSTAQLQGILGDRQLPYYEHEVLAA